MKHEKEAEGRKDGETASYSWIRLVMNQGLTALDIVVKKATGDSCVYPAKDFL